jgi:hypothetical protein
MMASLRSVKGDAPIVDGEASELVADEEGLGSQATQQPQDEWEEHKGLLTRLWLTAGKKLSEVMHIMKEEHGFVKTYELNSTTPHKRALRQSRRPKQYKTRFARWNLRKNVKSGEIEFIIHKRQRRKENGKETQFQLRGIPVPEEKIERSCKRLKLEPALLQDPCDAPGEYLETLRCMDGTDACIHLYSNA